MTHVKNELIVNVCEINKLIKLDKLSSNKLCHSGKKSAEMKNKLQHFK